MSCKLHSGEVDDVLIVNAVLWRTDASLDLSGEAMTCMILQWT